MLPLPRASPSGRYCAPDKQKRRLPEILLSNQTIFFFLFLHLNCNLTEWCSLPRSSSRFSHFCRELCWSEGLVKCHILTKVILGTLTARLHNQLQKESWLFQTEATVFLRTCEAIDMVYILIYTTPHFCCGCLQTAGSLGSVPTCTVNCGTSHTNRCISKPRVQKANGQYGLNDFINSLHWISCFLLLFQFSSSRNLLSHLFSWLALHLFCSCSVLRHTFCSSLSSSLWLWKHLNITAWLKRCNRQQHLCVWECAC